MTDQKTPSGWTAAQIDLVQEMWAKGATSSQIALSLRGKSRSAIVGIVYRKGFKRRGPTRTTSTPMPCVRPVARNYLRSQIALWDRAAPPVSLAGPSWSVPPNARHVSQVAA